jgi:hypothetical protein
MDRFNIATDARKLLAVIVEEKIIVQEKIIVHIHVQI